MLETTFEEIAKGIIDEEVAVVTFLFDAALLERLRKKILDKLKSGQLKKAGTGNRHYHQLNETVRGDRIEWLGNDPDDKDEKMFVKTINHLTEYLNRTCYTGIRSHEFHYACFEAGTFYKRHLDRFRNDDSRKFSVITYLNSEWDENYGGELVIYRQNSICKILPHFGTTVVFRSHLLEHEVLPAHKDRLSITGWLK